MTPEIHAKGWGYEVWLHNDDGYCMKLLVFERAGARGSLHYHERKHETWWVASGRFMVEGLQADQHLLATLCAGESLHLPAGAAHRLTCIEPGTIVEASTTHDEADVVRLAPGDSQNASPSPPRTSDTPTPPPQSAPYPGPHTSGTARARCACATRRPDR